MMWREQLPEELVVEIISRLPVQPLLRFRCVSKTWKSLIDSSSFLKLHISKNRSSNVCVLLNLKFGRPGTTEIELKLAAVDLGNCSDRILVQSPALRLVSTQQTTGLMGSCEGLFCVGTLNYKEFYLLNPSTREYRILPPPIRTSTKTTRHHYLASGLGYDWSGDEYKFVIISRSGSKAKIYGSKSKAWREKDVSSNYKNWFGSRYGKYAHGALHWNATARDHSLFPVRIAAFDFATEKLTGFEYENDLFGNPSHVNLEVLDGQLCLCCGHGDDHEEGFMMDVWVMKEYGVKESWFKLATFDRKITPVAFSKCGNHLLMFMYKHWPCECNFHWYDLNKKSMECTHLRRHWYYGLCIQSLIRLERKLP